MATLKLEISPELEQQLRDRAAQQGLDPDHYVLSLLQEQLQPQSDIPHLSAVESVLIEQINLGLSAEDWEQYHDLIAKRRAETLNPDEQTKLLALSDQIEVANARRIAALIQLANLHGTSLEAEMRNLRIEIPADG